MTIKYFFRYVMRLALKIIYFGAGCIHKVLLYLFKPFINMHPRIYRFTVMIRDAFVGLLRPPDVIEHVTEEIGKTVEIKCIDIESENQNKVFLPDWLIDEMNEIHHIEPRVFPAKHLIGRPPEYRNPVSRIAKPYIDICDLYGDDVSHLILVPWIERGGADLVALNYIRAIIESNETRNIVVVTTINTDSPWIDKLPSEVRLIEFGKKYYHLTEIEQEILLTRLLLQKAPNVIHNINSELGYKIFVKYGKALSQISNLYATVFCVDENPEGKRVGYPFSYLPMCFDYLKAVSVDNQTFIDSLIRIYAFDKNKLHLHYQPTQIIPREAVSKQNRAKDKIDILWAGRLDRQKCPEILLQIAESCENTSFRFHVYGIPVLSDDTIGMLSFLTSEDSEKTISGASHVSFGFAHGNLIFSKRGNDYYMLLKGKTPEVKINQFTIQETHRLQTDDIIEIGSARIKFTIKNVFIEKLKNQKNVKYYGVFNKLDSLDIMKYDLFLYTSRWDGMPTILLDAMKLRLPIIASNVGGISEIVENGKTGFLIEPFDDVSAYLSCLDKIYKNQEKLDNIVSNAYSLVMKKHSWENFKTDLGTYPGYLSNSTK
jgi:glycosyltransferase involved in cell wall biosynthesis